ncbi:SPFH domain-containing protein [Eubacteriaceae bacterium ES2]|nr:SPFH domain-containing protein [Eubacteriaceae bacterium ES2]
MGLIVVIFLLIIVIVLVVINTKIVPQANAYVVERLGAYHSTWETGFHIAIPIIDRVSKRISLKESVADFPPQPVITKDNVTMQIDTVIYMQVTDPKFFMYGVDNPMKAIENLTATTLRNIIGDMELDATLTSRDVINTKMRVILDEATDPWGIKINRVELKNIMPPQEIQNAMERQMKAERERREMILQAEGERQSAILVAEGEKKSMVLQAEGQKEAVILNAEADKESQIRRAEGEAEAILKVQNATAEGIKMLNEAGPAQAVIALKSLTSLEKMANGQATKIIIPSEIQGLASLAATLKETINDPPSN